MAQNPHGHDILDLLAETPMSRDALKAELEKRYGENPQFRTCKWDAVGFDELFEFFIAREKVVETDGLYGPVRANRCSH